jgi:hypothetical protein
VVPRRMPRYSYSNRSSSRVARSWARARAVHASRLWASVGQRPRSTRPAGIRTIRTVLRDGTRRNAALAHGWRR